MTTQLATVAARGAETNRRRRLARIEDAHELLAAGEHPDHIAPRLGVSRNRRPTWPAAWLPGTPRGWGSSCGGCVTGRRWPSCWPSVQTRCGRRS